MQQINVPPIMLYTGLVGWWEVLGLESILNSCANYLSKWRNVPEKGDQFVKEMNHKELIFIFQLHQFSGALAIKSISFSGDGHMLPYYIVPKAKKSFWIHSWCPKPLPKRTKGMHGCFNWLIANLYHGKMVANTKQLNKRWLFGVLRKPSSSSRLVATVAKGLYQISISNRLFGVPGSSVFVEAFAKSSKFFCSSASTKIRS